MDVIGNRLIEIDGDVAVGPTRRDSQGGMASSAGQSLVMIVSANLSRISTR
jgi:hypothetical protein